MRARGVSSNLLGVNEKVPAGDMAGEGKMVWAIRKDTKALVLKFNPGPTVGRSAAARACVAAVAYSAERDGCRPRRNLAPEPAQ